MKTLLLAACCFLVGCSAVPKTMQGTYSGSKPDFVIIKRDGAVYWSPMSKTEDKAVFVGIASPKKNDLEVPLIVPSASTFFGSKLTYSSDFSRLYVDWGQDLRGHGKDRSTEYLRNAE
ncbi:hypothetical protein JIN85_20280 [Luteolibacter pohnpeiensis]|uniref:Lipoprotein n=1 Tax=Luteolibacter pohnpeiensis TaxID=454153 RepID=A0A934SC05_9BACT|nr:hypothetical protein [Luteolibacter pohnpeiensis]MBK1884761.1 hypothetical protein [Luteolibacter pohnpeiensis]